MARKNLIIGLAAGAALVGAAYVMSKKSRFNLQSLIGEAEDLISGIKNRMGDNSESQQIGGSAHDGKHLAEKARQRVEHKLAGAKK